MSRRLEEERAGSSIRSVKLSHLLYGGHSRFERWRIIAEIFERDPVFDKTAQVFMNHTQRYVNACRKVVRYRELIEELGLTEEETEWAYVAIDGILPIDVHQAMFVPCLMYQTSPQQRELWLHDAKSLRILGAYAQTELAHGSNVRGLETTATFVQETQEFVLHSPTVGSIKWWPGGLGHTATHCVAHARLIIRGVDYGVHAFMVQLRSLEDHRPLRGVIVGDMGPKIGFSEIDNGYCRFDHVRIPRLHMLMGPAEVSEDGTYRKRKGSEKLLYGAMLHVRASLVSKASLAIARALTIAVRYSAVRCQGFEEGATHRERPVLDYPTQQAALLPLVALAYALHFTGQRMHESYTSYLRTSDAAVLPELHAVSSGLKASITYMVADGIEVCRKMCGGHGYSHLSGLPELSHNYLAMCTLEGTREVLEPQCTRYLLRCFADTSTEPLSAEVEYLRRSQELLCFRCDIPSDRELMCTNAEQLLLTLFEARSVRALARARQAQEQANGSAAEAALEAGLEMGTASRAHSQLHMLRSFVIHMQRLEEQRIASESDVDFDGLGAAERAVLRQLLVLFALRVMQDNMNEFRDENLLSSEQANMAHSAIKKLTAAVRVHAVPLVEAWAMSDTFLNSALGRQDGDVYTALYLMAQREPLNATDVSESYEHLRKLIGRPQNAAITRAKL